VGSIDRGAEFLDRAAELKPVVVSPLSLRGAIEKMWRDGLPPGDRSGWPSMDRYYSVPTGLVTIVTGWPGSGKSEWLDALLVHLGHQGWKIAIFSPENQPLELHAAKHMEKVSGKPFGHGPTERIGFDEIPEFLDELAGWFHFIHAPSVETSLTVRSVIEAATPWLEKQGPKRGLVIDPWNELEHSRPSNLSETEYISKTLSFVRNWARANQIHVWIVAHPQKMRREDGKLPVAKLDMISGSQHWWNKADFGISIWRDQDDPDNQIIDVHVLKVRFKHTGRVGVIQLRYDRVSGRYHEVASLRDVKKYANKGEEE
jgi:twinkle protein